MGYDGVLRPVHEEEDPACCAPVSAAWRRLKAKVAPPRTPRTPLDEPLVALVPADMEDVRAKRLARLPG